MLQIYIVLDKALICSLIKLHKWLICFFHIAAKDKYDFLAESRSTINVLSELMNYFLIEDVV